MCTAVVVVSLPALKPLLIRHSPNNSSYRRSTSGYMQHPGSGKPLSNPLSNHGTSRSQIQGGRISDDELELVFQGARIDKRSQLSTTSSTDPPTSKDNVLVTKEYDVTTHAI